MKIAIIMPKTIRPENKFSSLLGKVTEYIQAVEEGEDASYHLRYLRSLKKQIEGKLNKNGEISSDLQAVYDMLETFLPYHETRR